MPKTILFKDNVFSAGRQGITGEIPFFFPYNEGVTKSQIDYIYPDCPACTHCEVTEQGIKGKVIIEKASTYIEDITSVTKTVYVKLKDGICEFSPNKDMKRGPNKNARVEKLNIAYAAVK